MHNRYLIGVAASFALGAALVACGGSDDSTSSGTQTAPAAQTAATAAPTTAAAAASAPSAPTTIELKAGDFYYQPKDVTARPGKITIMMANESSERPHTIGVKKADGSDYARSGRAEAGQAITLELTIDQEGTYEMYCSLPGHADRGQKGTLTVKNS